MKPREPGFAPELRPVRMRCASRTTHGWVYIAAGVDPTAFSVEVPCRGSYCKRPGCRTHHIFNANGDYVDVFLPFDQENGHK